MHIPRFIQSVRATWLEAFTSSEGGTLLMGIIAAFEALIW